MRLKIVSRIVWAGLATLSVGSFCVACASQPAAPDRSPAPPVASVHPRELIAELEQHGFRVSAGLTWRQSRWGGEWLGQTRQWFGPTDFPNEAEVGFNSQSDSGPYKVSVQAEVYTTGRGEAETVNAAILAARVIWPNFPEEAERAFKQRRTLKIGDWDVEFFDNQGRGYVTGINGTLPAIQLPSSAK